MAYYESQGLSGRLTIELRNREGQLVLKQQHDNLITSSGKKLIARLFTGELSGKPELSMAVGDSKDTAQETDNRLGNQLDEVSATPTAIHTSQINQNLRAVAGIMATFPVLAANNTQVLREAGIVIRFPNQTPVLYNHVNFPDISRTDKLEMTLSWEVLF